MGGVGGEHGVARGGEAGLGGDRVGRLTGDSESGTDATGREGQGEFEGWGTERWGGTTGEG